MNGEITTPKQTGPAPWKLIVAGAGFSLLVAAFFSIWAHIVITIGVQPEAIIAADYLGPLLAIFASSAWAARQSKSAGWKIGVGIALILVVMWLLIWCQLVARWNFSSWPADAFGTLNFRHFRAWILALIFGALGGKFGQTSKAQQRHFLFKIGLIELVLLLFAMCFQTQWSLLKYYAISDIRTFMKMNVSVSTDSTTVRFFEVNCAKPRTIDFNIYDADSDDKKPFDDRNTTFLGQSIDFVFDKVQRRERARGRDVICMVNGGFFGADDPWIGFHEAPLKFDGVARYDSRILENDWPQQSWTFAISRNNGKPRFHILPDIKFSDLKNYETVLGGVRALRVNGQSLDLKPGIGNLKMRTSRTSIGWSADSSKFYVLSVRDPDGEAASSAQKAAGFQTGGWDIEQVQQFWTTQNVPNAVLFDGGESTQIAYGGKNPIIVRSGYMLGKTLGYWNQRPLRVVFPLMPPEINGGVLNYFYITAPKR